MQPILVAFATAEGHTRKIAEFIAERLRIRGHRVDLVDCAAAAAEQLTPAYQAAILGGPVHQGQHPASLVHFAKHNRDWLAAMPTAVFSVSLAAAMPDMDSRLEAQRALSGLLDETALAPLTTRCIAGALKYTQYDYFKRLIMTMISRQVGRTTDVSRDHEYTDWADVEAFVDDFLATARLTNVPSVAAATTPRL